MQEKIDKARKQFTAWAVDVDHLKQLSERTGTSQVELLHKAVSLLEEHISDQERAEHVS